ncbi:MAG: tetratricopeptide repeat protein, partial [Cystobacter sp.]
MTLAVLCCAASNAAGEEQPDPRLPEAQAAFDEAEKFLKAGKSEEAISQAEQSLKIRKTVLGDSHLEVAASLNQLSRLHRLRRDFNLAEPLAQQSLALREVTLDPQ